MYTLKSQSKAVTQQPNAWENDARVLERWLVELLQHFIVLLPNKEALLFESIRSQMARTKANVFPELFFLWQYKAILKFFMRTKSGHFVLRII